MHSHGHVLRLTYVPYFSTDRVVKLGEVRVRVVMDDIEAIADKVVRLQLRLEYDNSWLAAVVIERDLYAMAWHSGRL